MQSKLEERMKCEGKPKEQPLIDILSAETGEKEEGDEKEEIVVYSEIEGRIKTLALTHDGSRVLQRFFQKCSIEELD